MDIQNEIIRTIELMVDKIFEKKKVCRTIPSVIQEVDGDLYKVRINGGDFWLKSGTNLTLAKGKAVWVHIPDSNITNAFIIAYR